jgi:DNA-binding Lrp family transcriptional regulator
MDKIDREILSLINKSLPLARRPYKAVAETVGIEEREVLERVRKMKAEGLIRRIGAVIDPRVLGWQSTLCAADVPEDRLDEFAEAVGRHDEVTHSYVREGVPNFWFTLIAPSRERLTEIISELQRQLGTEIRSLPARKVFKIRVALDIV